MAFGITPYGGLGINTGLGIFITLRTFGLNGARATNSSLGKTKKVAEEAAAGLNKFANTNLKIGALFGAIGFGAQRMTTNLMRGQAPIDRWQRSIKSIVGDQGKVNQIFRDMRKLSENPNLFVESGESMYKTINELASIEITDPTKILRSQEAIYKMVSSSSETTADEVTRAYAQMYQAWGKYQPDLGTWIKSWENQWAEAIKVNQLKGGQLGDAIERVGARAAMAGIPVQNTIAELGAMISTAYQSSPSSAGRAYHRLVLNLGRANKDLGVDFTWTKERIMKAGKSKDLLGMVLPPSAVAEIMSRRGIGYKPKDGSKEEMQKAVKFTSDQIMGMSKAFDVFGASALASIIVGLPSVAKTLRAELGTMDRLTADYTKDSLGWHLNQMDLQWGFFKDSLKDALKDNWEGNFGWIQRRVKNMDDIAKNHPGVASGAMGFATKIGLPVAGVAIATGVTAKLLAYLGLWAPAVAGLATKLGLGAAATFTTGTVVVLGAKVLLLVAAIGSAIYGIYGIVDGIKGIINWLRMPDVNTASQRSFTAAEVRRFENMAFGDFKKGNIRYDEYEKKIAWIRSQPKMSEASKYPGSTLANVPVSFPYEKVRPINTIGLDLYGTNAREIRARAAGENARAELLRIEERKQRSFSMAKDDNGKQQTEMVITNPAGRQSQTSVHNDVKIVITPTPNATPEQIAEEVMRRLDEETDKSREAALAPMGTPAPTIPAHTPRPVAPTPSPNAVHTVFAYPRTRR